jgi:hypothetical protein
MPMPSRLIFGLLTQLSMATIALAQLPNPALDFIYPPGGQAGTRVVVQVGGRDLDEGHRLVFSHPGISGAVVTRDPGEFETGAQPVTNQFAVAIPLNVLPGEYDVRVVGRFGVSTPRTFIVSDVSEQLEPAEHQVPDKAMDLPLDTVVNGRTEGGAIDYYRFSASKGQSLIVECIAQPIDSQLMPIITIWDERQHQLARSKHLLDPILEFVAPEDGKYLLGINDHVFEGGTTRAYRLQIHSGPYLLAISPAVAQPGAAAMFSILGRNLPDAEEVAGVQFQGLALKRKSVSLFIPAGNGAPAVVNPVTASPEGFLFRWPTRNGYSNSLLVAYAEHPVIAEAEANNTPDTAQSVGVPCDFSGSFYPRRDQDWVQFQASKGQSYQVRVISHRLGQPTDPEVVVQKVVGTQDGKSEASVVSTEDDFRTDRDRYRQPLRRGLELSHRDPVVRFTADQDGDYRVGLRDLNGSSLDDPRFTYRLVIAPQRGDFKLLVWTQRQATDDDKKIDRDAIVLRRSGRLPLLVDVLRQGGFDGEVRLSAGQLPKGVTADECLVPAGQTEGVLILNASSDAVQYCGPMQVVGQAVIDGQIQKRMAREAFLTGATGNVEQDRPTARLARQMFLAVVEVDSEPAEIDVAKNEATGSRHWQTCRGAKLTIPVSYVKHAELKGDLGLAAIGLPDKIKADGLTLKPDATEGQLQLTLDSAEIKAGAYSIFLRGALKAAYARNPQALAASQQRRSEFDTVIGQLDQQITQAAERLTQAQKTAAAQSDQLTQFEATQQAIAQGLELASQQVKLASDQLTGLQQGAASAQGEHAAAILKLAQDAQVAAAEAAVQVQKAQSNSNQIKDQLVQSRGQLQSVQTAVTEAESLHKKLTEAKQRAAEYVKQLDQQLADAQKNLGPQDVTTYVQSPAIMLEVLNSPLAVALPMEPLHVRRGQSCDIAVQIQRRFGFADEVNLALKVPDGVQELSAEPQTVGKDQGQGALRLTAGPNASAGQHTLYIQQSLKFNGIDIQDQTPLQVVVEP